ELDERLPVALLFAGRDPDVCRFGQLPVALIIVGTERLFEPEDIVIGEGPGALQGGLRVPHEAGVDQQIRAVAQSFATSADQRDIGLRIVAHRVPAELDGGESLVAIAPSELAGLFRSWTEQRAGVTANLLMEPAAEQLPHGQAERFALDIPQRHVD